MAVHDDAIWDSIEAQLDRIIPQAELDLTFSELGVDSLDHTELIMVLEDRFDVEVRDDVAEQLMTPRLLIEYVAALVGGGALPTLPPRPPSRIATSIGDI